MVALPVCAQRGGSRGGFSGHSGSISRGGFAASAPSRGSGFSSGYRGFAASRPPVVAPGFRTGYQRGMAGYPASRSPYRSPYTGGDRHRRPYVPGYRGGSGYIAPGYGWVGPYFPWYPDDSGYDDSSPTPSQQAEGYDAGPPYPEQQPDGPSMYPPYPSAPSNPSATVQPHPASEPSSEEEVTLVFKDGRPPVQVHDYVLTRNTLYVWDRRQVVIPTDQLDLVATAKVNRDAGVDFRLPETAQ